MSEFETTTEVKVVYPYIKLECAKNLDKEYLVHRDRILHAQTHKDDPNWTFVKFQAGDEILFASLDIDVDEFNEVLRDAYGC